MKSRIQWKSLSYFAAATVLFVLLSPRWPVPLAAFVAPALLLWLIREKTLWRSFLVTLSVLTIANGIANYRVMPFPAILYVPLIIQISVIASIPYVAYSWMRGRYPFWETTLLFPVLQVLTEYVNSFFGGGTWGSIAYTQLGNLAFSQLASVTGLWGMTFLVYWFSSIAVYCLESRWKWSFVRKPVSIFVTLFMITLLYGAVRLTATETASGPTVKVSGVTASNLHLLGIIYEDAFGKKIEFQPDRLTQTSPELKELNLGLVEFIKDPFASRFTNSQRSLVSFQDSMLHRAEREAKAGAKIIAFSEALMFTFKPLEEKLIQKGQKVARDNKVTLLLTMASFIPGETTFGSKFIENKAVMINPFGEIEHIFFKNKPVPVVEPSIAGDEEVPVYNSLYGRLATSICYDADFPSLMRKAGEQGASILLLPSGDWREISPYHSGMSRMRAIENGFSVLRPVSGATSIACDPTGRVLSSRNFYTDGDKIVTAHLPVNGVATLYAQFGDYFPWLCVAIGIVVLIVTTMKVREGSGVKSGSAAEFNVF